MDHTRVCLPRTKVRKLQSPITGELYRLSIAYPEKYSESRESFPVLYILDDPWLFALYVQIVRTLRIFSEVPEMIMVGIGYPTDLQADWFALRMRDYTPTTDEEFVRRFPEDVGLPLTPLETSSGGAESFLDFLETICIPYIESEYRVDHHARMLAGWSFGGVFGLYAMFTRPSVFNSYLVTSPSLWWGDEILWSYEERFSKVGPSQPTRLYLSIGSEEREESINKVIKLKDRLFARAYPGFDLAAEVLDKESHLSVVAPAFSRGIRWVMTEE